uniref:Transmembrane 9 superfamily member n=1 Tax=Rhabditophanes sp. KR3021 TaxID=114890 RepID=A0AC35UBU4_9BILA
MLRVDILSISLIFCYCIAINESFYLPGLNPVNFCELKDAKANCPNNVTLFVNKLDSEQSVIPYEYHSFDFCIGSEEDSPVENLGQILWGERIRASPYRLSFKEEKTCEKLCTKSYKSSNNDDMAKLKLLQKGMKFNYQHHWIIDNMPISFCYPNSQDQNICTSGYHPMGCYVTPQGKQKDACVLDAKYKDPDSHYIFNHVDIEVEYRDMTHDPNFLEDKIGGRIIHIKIFPRSIKHNSEKELNCGPNAPPLALKNGPGDSEIVYTYSVKWSLTNVKWNSRWDSLLNSSARNLNVQWISIMNSIIIVLFLSGMVGMILMRTLHRDIIRYNQFDNEEDAHEEFGWKLLHANVFRPPKQVMFLAVFVGSGSQILLSSAVTILFACLGFLSPANRGSLMTFALVFYAIFGIASGYVSARVFKTLKGVAWKTNILLTSFFIPGILFSIFFVTNLMLWAKGSSAAVPFGTLIALLSLWLLVSTPLTLIGAIFGFKKPPFHPPVRTHQIPRQIPEQSFYTKPLPGILMGSILPFGCIFIQLFFILNSLWANQIYYLYGFLLLVYLILIVTCSLTTILLTYFHLCSEDYRWAWRSFLTSGFTAGYLFLYCVYFFNSKLAITGIVSTILYFSYTAIFVFMFFLMTGTIGYISTYYFIHKIYSSIKVD